MSALGSVLVAAILLSGAAPPLAIDGARPQWIKYASSPLTDWTNRVIERRNGRIVAAGFINRDDQAPVPDWNMFVEGYDPQGRGNWSQSFGGPGVDAAWAVLERTDGRLVVAGISSQQAGGDTDAALMITDDRPRNVINRRFGGEGDDRATDIIALSDRNLLLVGQTDTKGAGGIDVFLVKTDANGNELWRKTYGGKMDDRGFYGVETEDGGAIIAGVTGPRGAYDLLLMRVAADGSEVWHRVISGKGNDATHGLARLADGRILLAGYGPSWAGRGNDISVLLFDDAGKLLSHQAIGGPGDDRVQFAASDPKGGAWLTGYTKSFSNDWRMLVARVSSEGRIEPWMGAIGGKGAMNGSAAAVARNGDLLLGGYSNLPSHGAALPDAFTMRVAPQSIQRRTNGVQVHSVPTKCRKQDQKTSICR